MGAARDVGGVNTVSPSAYANTEVDGREGPAVRLEPRSEDSGRVLKLDWVEGSSSTLKDLKDDEIVVDDEWARRARASSVGDSSM